MKYFMIDIESMGLDFANDDIIQIGILECIKKDGFYWPGKTFIKTLYTNQKPKDAWIEKNHKDLLPICKISPRLEPATIRKSLLEFFKECGVEKSPMLMGLNLTVFDIPYLMHKQMLAKEDFHYRVYELKGAYNVSEDGLNVDSKELFKRAYNAFPEIQMPEGKKHEALYDCYNQLRVLNGCIRLIRQTKAA